MFFQCCLVIWKRVEKAFHLFQEEFTNNKYDSISSKEKALDTIYFIYKIDIAILINFIDELFPKRSSPRFISRSLSGIQKKIRVFYDWMNKIISFILAKFPDRLSI